MISISSDSVGLPSIPIVILTHYAHERSCLNMTTVGIKSGGNSNCCELVSAWRLTNNRDFTDNYDVFRRERLFHASIYGSFQSLTAEFPVVDNREFARLEQGPPGGSAGNTRGLMALYAVAVREPR